MTPEADDLTATLNATDEQEVKFDRHGRYVLPHPETGEVMSWPRMTTLVNTTQDQSGLHLWKSRKLVKALSDNDHLLALAASIATTETREDKKQLDEIINTAHDAAGTQAKANIGTAIHAYIQRTYEDDTFEAPAKYRADVEAFKSELAKYGMWPL